MNETFWNAFVDEVQKIAAEYEAPKIKKIETKIPKMSDVRQMGAMMPPMPVHSAPSNMKAMAPYLGAMAAPGFVLKGKRINLPGQRPQSATSYKPPQGKKP